MVPVQVSRMAYPSVDKLDLTTSATMCHNLDSAAKTDVAATLS